MRKLSCIFRFIAQALLIAGITLAMLEGALRLVPGMDQSLHRTASVRPEEFWENRFLEMQASGKPLVFAGLHQTHPTRGWTTKPNISVTHDGVRYTTNNRGHRSLNDYEPRSDAYRVLIVGDSYTFGIDADDGTDWPSILQRLDPTLQVINLGVGGYGFDQMCLTLRETIVEYEPHLVIAAFIGDDLERSLLSFRDYRKPRFVLQEGRLLLTNTPVESPEETCRLLQDLREAANRPKFSLRIVDALRTARAKLASPAAESLVKSKEIYQLNARLADDMARQADAHCADFLLVQLAYGPWLRDASLVDPGVTFLDSYVAEHPVRSLKTRPHFLLRPRDDWAMGHYQAREATLVAQLVQQQVSEIRASSDSYSEPLTAQRPSQSPRR